MKTVLMRRVAAAGAAVAVAVALGGCLKNKEQTAEIERLNAELEELREDAASDRERIEELEKESAENSDKAKDAERKARRLESQLADAERQVERYQLREAEAAKRKPTRAEKQAQGKELAAGKVDAVAGVEGDKVSGHGVLVEADGKTWLYAPASLLAANTKLEISAAGGERLQKFGEFAVASGADLVRLEVQDKVAAKLAPAAAAELASGTPLFGVDAAQALVEGTSYDVQPGELRVDPMIGKCPPGTPVFHGETGGLLGIVGEPLAGGAERDLWGGGGGYEQPDQRPVVRLDRVIKWVAVPIGAFLEEGKVLGQADRMTRLVEAFVAVKPGVEGMDLGASVGSAQTARQVLEENKSIPAVRSLMELEAWLKGRKMKPSETDLNRRVGSVYGQLAGEVKRQTAELKGRVFSPFHEAAAKQSLGWRGEAEKKLAELLARTSD